MLSSIRGRLALWNFLVISLLLVTFSLTLYWTTSRNLHLETDVFLQAKAEMLIGQIDYNNGAVTIESPQEFLQEGLLLQVQDVYESVLFKLNQTSYSLPIITLDVQSQVIENGSMFLTHFDGTTDIRILVTQDDHNMDEEAAGEGSILFVSVGVPLDKIEKSLGSLRLWLLGISFSLLLITNTLTLLFTGRLIQPLAVMAKAADEITEKKLDQRLRVQNEKDEIGQLGAAFNRLFERLHIAFETQRRFVSDASHELRTPLAIVQGKLEVTLRKRRSTEEYHQAIETALDQTRRLSGLVQSLLLLARADSGRLDIERSLVRLDQLCEEVGNRVKMLLIQKQIQLDIAINAHPAILGDKGLVGQALLNLVENAIKYTPGGGRVEINLGKNAHHAIITILDTGIGIAKSEMPHLFERFYRVDKARSREIPGTGLGLSIAQQIILLHHGKIKIDSQLNKGTVVTVTFDFYSEFNQEAV